MHRFIPLLLVPSILLGGCTSWLAEQIVTAPGPNETNLQPSEKGLRAMEENLGLSTLRIPVGPPEAELAVTLVPSRDYGLEYSSSVDTSEGKFTSTMKWAEPDELGPVRESERGTAIFLTGATMSRFTMLPWAMGFAAQGFQSVLVDYRGHGGSSGRHITYGVQEARDLQQIAVALKKRGVLEDSIVVMGVSMGAATALYAAPELEGLRAVIAVSPYADASEAIYGVGRGISPWLSMFISDERLDVAIHEASRIIGQDIRRIRPMDIVDEVNVPVLFIHGSEDHWVPPRHSMELYLSKEGPADLWVVPEASHMDLPARYDELSERVFDWLESALDEAGSAPTVTNGTREVRPDVSS